MPAKLIERLDEAHPAPSAELPEGQTYLLLGCGACEHSVRLRVSDEERMTTIEQAAAGLSPRRITNQGLTHADANITCPSNPRQCPNVQKLQTVNFIVDLLEDKESTERIETANLLIELLETRK